MKLKPTKVVYERSRYKHQADFFQPFSAAFESEHFISKMNQFHTFHVNNKMKAMCLLFDANTGKVNSKLNRLKYRVVQNLSIEKGDYHSWT